MIRTRRGPPRRPRPDDDDDLADDLVPLVAPASRPERAIEPVAGRVIEVIEGPYLKPTVTLRSPGVTCGWTRIPEITARLAPVAPVTRTVDEPPDQGMAVTVGALGQPTADGVQVLELESPAVAPKEDWSTLAAGAVVAIGYAAGSLFTSRPASLVGVIAVAVALCVAFAVGAGSVRLLIAGRGRIRCALEIVAAAVVVGVITSAAADPLPR